MRPNPNGFYLTGGYIISTQEPDPSKVEILEKVNSYLTFDPVATSMQVFFDLLDDPLAPGATGAFSMSLDGYDWRVPQRVWAGVATYSGGKEIIYLPQKYCLSNGLIFPWVYAHECRHVLTRLYGLSTQSLESSYEEVRRQTEFGIDERQLVRLEEFDAELFAKKVCKALYGDAALSEFFNRSGDSEQTQLYYECLAKREELFGNRLPPGI